MVEVKQANNGVVSKLTKALVQGLKQAGIPARVNTEPVRLTNLWRVYVIARKFKNLRPSERQDLVWRIAGLALTPDEQLRISMILTVTPEELKGNW